MLQAGDVPSRRVAGPPQLAAAWQHRRVAVCDDAGPGADRWLPLAGRVVQQLRVDHQLTLLLDDAVVTIESPAVLEAPDLDPPAVLVPDQQEVAAALRLFGMEIAAATVSDEGQLLVEFGGSVVLRVEPDTRLEAWSVTGPRDLRVTCTPGGRLALLS